VRPVFLAPAEHIAFFSVSPPIAMRLLALIALLPLAAPLRADDARPTKYTAVVTGIACQTCKTTVIDSLKKLPGVKEVDFAKGDADGSHKLTFAAKDDNLTKNDAELALGEHAKEFAIISFEKTK
jgi:copper chaperone CopZ